MIRRTRSSARLVASSLVLCLIACSDSSTGVEAPENTVITWGSTGVLYQMQNDNARLIRNFLTHLGQTRNRNGAIRILYTSPCDPRTDPGVCQLGDVALLDPFFSMIAEIGTIEFSMPSRVNLDDFDVVIANFCRFARYEQEVEQVRSYLRNGGPTLVLADNFCHLRLNHSSAAAANEVMSPFGLTFTNLDPAEINPLEVPTASQTGLLAGVSTVWIWRVTPQTITHNFEPILESELGMLAAIGTVQ